MCSPIVSISIPPFPDFIEGNVRIFKIGQKHPNRRNLGYFDLIVVKRGTLFLEEDGVKYEIKANEMFILLPNKHHFSWKSTEETTCFYWVHFYTSAQWIQSNRPRRFVSELPIPELHYFQKSYTLYLRKHTSIKEPELVFELVQKILDSTEELVVDKYDIWRTEELFLRLLRLIEEQSIHKDRLSLLAEQVHLYLENHFKEEVTNPMLTDHFHLHSNYIAKAMKLSFDKTPLQVLLDIRIERAKQLLLRSNFDMKEIAIETGFNSEVYFSERFKKQVDISPKHYRKKYEGQQDE